MDVSHCSVLISACLCATLISGCSDTAVAPTQDLSDTVTATYEFVACAETQPYAPIWEGVGVHTHGHGDIHIHPYTSAEAGSGSRLVKWFSYGSGLLTMEEIRMPGLSRTWKNGDTCLDGSTGEVQVSVNGQPLDDWTRYIPADGDKILLVFGAPAGD